jgi:predicted phage terminase large subunit-like protein
MSSYSKSSRSFAPPTLDQIWAERSKRHLFTFSQFTAPREYQWSWHHQVLHGLLHDFAIGKRKRLIIEMPPRHGKSEGTSRRMPAWLFGAMPGESLLLCSHTSDLANEMSRDIRNIMDSDRYRLVFPQATLRSGGRDRDRADLFDVAGGGTFKAAGVGTGISGRGFTLGVIDDYFKDRDEANSQAHRERVWRWYTSTFHTRQMKGAGILITATRWHEDDLVGRLKRKIATGESEPFEILTLPAMSTDNRHPLDMRTGPGQALWPWFRDEKAWEQRKKLEPRDFYALDQQDPRSEGGTEWDSSLFPSSIWFDDWPKNLQILVCALDPSKGRDAKSGDYSAIVALGRTSDGTLWVEADLQRRNTKRILDDSIEITNRLGVECQRPVDGFGVESDQFQELLADQLRQRQESRQFGSMVYNMTTGGTPKVVRIRRLTPYLTQGKFRFRNTPGTRLLVSQLEQFPNADHDDGPDALEYAIRLATHLWNGRKK